MKWKIGIAAAGIVGVALVAWAAFFFFGGRYVRQQHFAEAKKAAAELARDPDSVKFRNFAYFEEANTVCGEMNSKNLFGAYNGYVGFVYMPKLGAYLYPLDDHSLNAYTICQTDGKK